MDADLPEPTECDILGHETPSACATWDRIFSKSTPSGQREPAAEARKNGTYRTERPREPSRAIRLPFSHYHANKLHKWPPTDHARRPKNAMMQGRENAIRIALPVPSFHSVRYVCHFRDTPTRAQGRAQAIFGRPYGTERKTGHGEAF